MNESHEIDINSRSYPDIRVEELKAKFPLSDLRYEDYRGRFFETNDGAILLATQHCWVVIASAMGTGAYSYRSTANGVREVTLTDIAVRVVQ